MKTTDQPNSTAHPEDQSRSKERRDDIYEIVEKVLARKEGLDVAWLDLQAICGATVDSRLGSEMWSCFDLMVDLAEKSIGDGSESLRWFIWDNDCGAKKLKASREKGGAMRIIRNINDLMWMMGW